MLFIRAAFPLSLTATAAGLAMSYFALLAGIRTVGRMLPLLLSRCIAHTRRFTAGTLCALVGVAFLALFAALVLLTLLALLLGFASFA